MGRIATVAVAFAVASSTALAASPFDALKGRVKPGEYEIQMSVEMPGAPAGMARQSHTMSQCITPSDIERGQVSSGREMPKDCEVKDFRMEGNSASYKTVCTGARQMSAASRITFIDDGYDMDMDMAMNQGGQAMNMKQHIKSRYLGPCKGNSGNNANNGNANPPGRK